MVLWKCQAVQLTTISKHWANHIHRPCEQSPSCVKYYKFATLWTYGPGYLCKVWYGMWYPWALPTLRMPLMFTRHISLSAFAPLVPARYEYTTDLARPYNGWYPRAVHGDVMKMRTLSGNCPFVKRFHRSPLDFPQKGPIIRSFGFFCMLGLEKYHYCDVIMGAVASQINSLTTVNSTVYSDADQRKHQSSALN